MRCIGDDCHRLWSATFFLSCFFLIFSLLLGSHSIAKNKPKHGQQAVSQAPILVNVATARLGSMPQQVSSLGNLEAIQSVTISAVADGRIQAINFKNGQDVSKGMPIVQLDNEQAEADYNSAVTALKLSRKNFERGKALVNVAISEQDIEKLEAEVAKNEAAVQSAQATLNQKEIVAPFSGVLGSFQVHEGDFVKAGAAIVALVDASQLLVDYSVPQALVAQIKKSQTVQVSSSAYPNKIFYGTVSYISPTVNQSTRTVSIQALLPNKDDRLKPGMFVHVLQQIAVNEKAVVVPLQAVQADIKGYHVFGVKDGRAQLIPVTLGARNAGLVEVVSGLKPGNVIVTAGQQKLDDGTLVRIISSNQPPESSSSSGSSTSSVQ